MGQGSGKWQEVLWREWRNTEDQELGEKLFAVVAEEPVDPIVKRLGAAIGLLGGFMVVPIVSLWSVGGRPYLYNPLSAEWFEAAGFLGKWVLASPFLGAVLGFGLVSILCRGWTWHRALSCLAPREPPHLLRLALISKMTLGVGIMLGITLGWSLTSEAETSAGDSPIVRYSRLLIELLLTGMSAASLLGLSLGLLSMAQKSPHIYGYRKRWRWWRKRPQPFELEESLRRACEVKEDAKAFWSDSLQELKASSDPPKPVSLLVADLRNENWATRFVARQLLFASGSLAMEPLSELAREKPRSSLNTTACWLMESIAADTASRLAVASERLVCPSCYVRCGPHTVRPSLRTSYTSYGCRGCSRSRDFLEWPGEIVAVLDDSMQTSSLQKDGQLLVNWLSRKAPFDFDRVEVLKATDEEVERLAIQTGNDTDVLRKARYRRMDCVLSTDCRLSENTMRVLRGVFGRVSMQQ